MATLGGFSPISKNGQVAIPKAIRDLLELNEGTQVLFRVSDDDPEVLQLIPAEVFEQRYARGESIGRLESMTNAAGKPASELATEE